MRKRIAFFYKLGRGACDKDSVAYNGKVFNVFHKRIFRAKPVNGNLLAIPLFFVKSKCIKRVTSKKHRMIPALFCYIKQNNATMYALKWFLHPYLLVLTEYVERK